MRTPRFCLSISIAAILTPAIVALMLLGGLRPSPAGAVADAENINSNPTSPAGSSGPPPDQPPIALPDGYTPSYPKVRGVTDATGPTTWRVLLLVYRNTDVDYVEGGVTKHMTTSMSQANIDTALLRFSQFIPAVADYSTNEAELVATVVHVTRPITSVKAMGNVYWLSPTDTALELDTYAPPGTYDSVEALWQPCDQTTSQCVPLFGRGAAVPASDWSNGATYASVVFGRDWWWNASYSWQVFLHEWLHGACDFYASLGYAMPVGDADGGGSHGYEPSPTTGWETYYRDLMTGQVWEPTVEAHTGITAAAWRNGSIISNIVAPSKVYLPMVTRLR